MRSGIKEKSTQAKVENDRGGQQDRRDVKDQAMQPHGGWRIPEESN